LLNQILTAREPFGPRDSETLLRADPSECDQLFDRNNLIYDQTFTAARPTYIIGRKGAGKTAFLRGATLSVDALPQRVLSTASVYADMASLLQKYRNHRGPLFTEHSADIWLALFEHVAMFHACDTTTGDDPPQEMQIVWDYFTGEPHGENATSVAARFLAEIEERILDDRVRGRDELIDGLTRGGVSFGMARQALGRLLAARPVMIVMDNLEDLHAQIFELENVLAGLFNAVGRSARTAEGRTFGLQLCLPSELWDEIHRISANPEKDFGGNYLTIYWTANELLRLAGRRYRLFMEAHHPQRLELMEPNTAGGLDHDVALLRAALPKTVCGGLGVDEDPVAYLLRHTQLLPRHLIEILNNVFTAPVRGSLPWAITPEAVRIGTQSGERMIVEGLFAAYRASYPFAARAIKRLANRLTICFPARQLRTVFNHEGIGKITGDDFDAFLDMLITLGVLGVKANTTGRYNEARFQYTFDSALNAHEDLDELCFHPLFTRYLFEHAFDDLRDKGELPTYPYGSDPDDIADYRIRLGYAAARRRQPR
jgi:hypothetical protein